MQAAKKKLRGGNANEAVGRKWTSSFFLTLLSTPV
jgi:hypothetical protein